MSIKIPPGLIYAILVYNFVMMAGAAYLCAVYEWSLWTMVVAFICMLDYRYDDED